MINTNKLVKSFVLALILVLSISSAAFAQNISVNGQSSEMTTMTVSGRTYVAMGDLTAFGVNGSIEGAAITLKDTRHQATLQFKAASNVVSVNDATVTLDAKPFIRNGVAYLPLKFIFETMNYSVGYDAATHRITLTQNKEFTFPVTIQDGALSYTIDAPVDRIVSLAPSVTEILFAIGAGDTVIGRTIYCDYPAESASIRTVGTMYEPDLEGILDLDPDAVIAATHMNEDVMNALSNAGIETVTQKTAEDIDDIYVLIEQLGAITGHAYESRALVASLEAKQDRVVNLVSQLPTSAKKRVYYVVGTGEYGEYTAGGDTFIGEVLEQSGAVNVAASVSGWNYTLEDLLDDDPAYIFGEAFNLDIMKTNSNYSILSAVKNDRLVEIDGNVFSRPGPRIIDSGMKTVIKTLYPQYAAELNY
ncbi:MAG: cobalamin transport system substrate-binding protein [Clostridiales bacterium]|jgi:iron complex transport system substrate-binding protein|nr:cobalamin transport system substrate-binding protein [Clostridiales bacterium]